MSFVLSGPFPFDARAVTACGRTALNTVGSKLRSSDGADLIAHAAPGVDPGLYVVLRVDDSGAPGGKRPEIAGFWTVLDAKYLEDGPAGPPDKVPPFAQALLDAATEEVWWQNLHVVRERDGSWLPVIVLEWPPFLAARSAGCPPGVASRNADLDDDDEGFAEDEPEYWLEAVEPAYQPMVTEAPASVGRMPDPYAGLSEQRGLILVVRGRLFHDGRLHSGSFAIVPPALLDEGGQRLAPMDAWLTTVGSLSTKEIESAEPANDVHQLGQPLLLLGDRMAFPMSGWLTKSLGWWPMRPSDLAVGKLTDRVVQSLWISQMRTAIVSSLMVLTTVLGFSLAIQKLAEPKPKPMDPPPPPAVQPAMSFCSEDHQQFIDEFRCQIAHMSTAAADAEWVPVCGDKGSTTLTATTTEDLQAAYCGLLDRGEDGWVAALGEKRFNFADVAAAQACFNVLGHPYPYKLTALGAPTGRLMSDPSRFLEDDKDGVEPLKELTRKLKEACASYRGRVEHRVEGAIFATHVGAPLGDKPETEPEPARLRRLLLEVGMVGVAADNRACFEVGMKEGLAGNRFSAYCSPTGEADKKDSTYDDMKIWSKLGGEPSINDQTLVGRYVHARFGYLAPKSAPDLWKCHLALNDVLPLPSSVPPAEWDFPLPVPNRYNSAGSGPRRQVQLDAILTAVRAGADAGTCWAAVQRRLSAYVPVHPLVTPVEADGWPSDEQQLCGQICAARYGVKRSANAAQWVTPESDLDICLSPEPPGETPDLGGGKLDQLRVPWNYTRKGWIKPTPSQICAFNLISQDLYPPAVEAGFIVGGRSPKQFGGETVSGSRIVGGPEGLAALAADGMTRGGAGSRFSVGACGQVATMCFSSVMMRVLGNEDLDGDGNADRKERYEWLEVWSQEVERLVKVRRDEVADVQPWCAVIHEYLAPEREAAQFDTPCQQGVETARNNVEAVIKAMAADISSEGKP